jgi:hypothetical protein
MHTDAAQTLGKLPSMCVNSEWTQPPSRDTRSTLRKGIGALYLKRRTPSLRWFAEEARSSRSAVRHTERRRCGRLCPRARDHSRGARHRGSLGSLRCATASSKASRRRSRTPRSAPRIRSGFPTSHTCSSRVSKAKRCSCSSTRRASRSRQAPRVLRARSSRATSCFPSAVPPNSRTVRLRASLGRFTTEEDVEYFLEVFPPIVEASSLDVADLREDVRLDRLVEPARTAICEARQTSGEDGQCSTVTR